jgi:hypothetical protein
MSKRLNILALGKPLKNFSPLPFAPLKDPRYPLSDAVEDLARDVFDLPAISVASDLFRSLFSQ